MAKALKRIDIPAIPARSEVIEILTCDHCNQETRKWNLREHPSDKDKEVCRGCELDLGAGNTLAKIFKTLPDCKVTIEEDDYSYSQSYLFYKVETTIGNHAFTFRIDKDGDVTLWIGEEYDMGDLRMFRTALEWLEEHLK